VIIAAQPLPRVRVIRLHSEEELAATKETEVLEQEVAEMNLKRPAQGRDKRQSIHPLRTLRAPVKSFGLGNPLENR
jgi:hypothetical protein